MDFIVMTRGSGNMFICGPEVIRAATGQVTTMDEIGSAMAHASVSGNIHFIANDDMHAVSIVRDLLSYLPSNNMADPPHDLSAHLSLADDPALDDLVPDDARMPIDVKKVIGAHR